MLQAHFTSVGLPLGSSQYLCFSFSRCSCGDAACKSNFPRFLPLHLSARWVSWRFLLPTCCLNGVCISRKLLANRLGQSGDGGNRPESLVLIAAIFAGCLVSYSSLAKLGQLADSVELVSFSCWLRCSRLRMLPLTVLMA